MIRILRIYFIGLAVGLLAVPDFVRPQPSVPPSPSANNPAPEYVPLREALPKISEQTGIQFQLPEELQGGMIPLQENGGAPGSYSLDWLKDYSYIEIADKQSGQRRIILMGSRASPPSQISKAPAPRKTLQANRSAQGKPKPTLSREKLLKLVKGSIRSPIPTELYQDEEYRNFFSAWGARSPEDLTNRMKAKKIRREARKLLHQMEPH